MNGLATRRQCKCFARLACHWKAASLGELRLQQSVEEFGKPSITYGRKQRFFFLTSGDPSAYLLTTFNTPFFVSNLFECKKLKLQLFYSKYNFFILQSNTFVKSSDFTLKIQSDKYLLSESICLACVRSSTVMKQRESNLYPRPFHSRRACLLFEYPRYYQQISQQTTF